MLKDIILIYEPRINLDKKQERERELLRSLQKDQRNGISEIFKEYFDIVCMRIYRIIPERQIAEDLSQDVFLDLWRRRDTLNIKSTLKGYLLKSALNKSLNYIRDNKFELQQSDQLYKIQTNESSPQIKLEIEEQQALVNAAINTLPEKCRLVFVLSRYEQLSYKEIAQKLDISVKTVENQMSKALKSLRISLKPLFKKGFAFFLAIIALKSLESVGVFALFCV